MGQMRSFLFRFTEGGLAFRRRGKRAIRTHARSFGVARFPARFYFCTERENIFCICQSNLL